MGHGYVAPFGTTMCQQRQYGGEPGAVGLGDTGQIEYVLRTAIQLGTTGIQRTRRRVEGERTGYREGIRCGSAQLEGRLAHFLAPVSCFISSMAAAPFCSRSAVSLSRPSFLISASTWLR